MSHKPFNAKFFYPGFLLLFSGMAYFMLSYLVTRENFTQVITLFTLLFAGYFLLYKFYALSHFKYLILAAFLFRFLLLFSAPNLSDDVYRFIWDGRLSAHGINPFRYLPSEIIQMAPIPGITPGLYGQLNSPGYYSVYPPILQSVFWLIAKLSPQNVFTSIVLLKSVIIVFEVGTFYLLVWLLKALNLPRHHSLLYMLNPLVIAELTGNVHFDGIMIFFILLAVVFILKKSWQASALTLGLAVATKLIPLIFMPLLIRRLGMKTAWLYLMLTGSVIIFLFALFMDFSTIQHLLQSANLFIKQFEFNASIYYVVRWLGSIVKGYNIIALAGPALVSTATGIILYVSFRAKKMDSHSLLLHSLYIISTWLLFSTTVHPWYICLPVALAVFTPYRYPLIWSFTAILSYAAYQYSPVHENLWVTGAGYIFLVGYALWEWKTRRYNNVQSIYG